MWTLIIIGFIIRHLAIQKIGNSYWRVKNNDIVTDGIYKYIRHPMYLGAILLTIGTFFSLCDWKTALCLEYIAIQFIMDRVDREEQILSCNQKYVEYALKTKRFIPFII